MYYQHLMKNLPLKSPTDRQLHGPGIRIFPVPVDIVDCWLELLQSHPVIRGRIFDVQLVATMLGNEVRRIYTFNVRDFTPSPELEVLVPPAPEASCIQSLWYGAGGLAAIETGADVVVAYKRPIGAPLTLWNVDDYHLAECYG
jgi:hypothetical protein